MNSARRVWAATLLAGFAVTAMAEISDKIDAPVGQISGQASTVNPNVVSFLGIPYAAPPTGENRWRAPQPVDMDRRFRAETYGAQCMQRLTAGPTPGRLGGGFAGQAPRGGGGFGGGGGGMRGFGPGGGMRPGAFVPQAPILTNEDCLYLNIWSGAESESAKRPVMVWIYGDQLQRGAGSDPRYIGELLASRGIVVVTFNYRVGIFGFLASPDLSSEGGGSSGNYGLMDAIAALEWVGENIEAFGGDPDNITVFSGSEGAAMTAALIGSPAGEGLFQRAVLQSGSWMGTGMRPMQTLAEAEQVGVEQLARFGAVSLAELRELPVDQLLGVLPEANLVVDGRIIPEDLSTTFAEGRQHPVDVIVGSNREEGTVLLERMNVRTTAADYEAAIRERFGSLADSFLRLYPSGSDELAISSYVTALGDEMAWQMRMVAERQTAVGAKAHVYAFTRVPPPSAGGQVQRGATHGAEVQYVFTTMGNLQAWTEGDRRLGQIMASYWINFAETGNPNGEDRWGGVVLPDWPQYFGSEEFQAMEFGDRIGTNPIWQLQPARIELFDQIYQSQVLGD